MIAVLDHWPRKLLALLLAILIWFLANNSMTTTKILHNIPVRIINLPEGKVVEEMQINGLLNKRLILTITGIESILNELTPKDLEVVIDARDTPEQWVATITKKNLLCLNQNIDLVKTIQRVAPIELILKKSSRITERIPVSIAPPSGKAPKGYQFLDVFPYQLYLTVTGPEEAIRRLKTKGVSLSFNLSELSRADLDTLWTKNGRDEISFFVPQVWKKISLPSISDVPFELDDPQASFLRIDFLRQELIPINAPIPVTIFFPMKHSTIINPETHSLATNEFIVKKNGVKTISLPLLAQGTDHLFLETVKDHLQIVIIAAPDQKSLSWSAQFAFPRELENQYVAKVLAEATAEGFEAASSRIYENYLRNRFRNYMTRFRLYTEKDKKLALDLELQDTKIVVTSKK
jgi:hypothetical protein